MRVRKRVPRKFPKRIRKIRYLLPNSFTAGSLLMGLFAVFFTLDGKLELAGWMVLWCTMLDKLDGLAARLVNATSDFGVEFDSFADFVAFGLAPGFLVYQHLVTGAPSIGWLPLDPQGGLIWAYRLAVAFYILCAGIRLATFNVRTGELGPDWFYGLPSTFCGGVIAAFLLTAGKYGFLTAVVPWLPLVLVALGVAMLAPFRLPKIKARRGHRYFNLFQGLVGGALFVFALLRKFPELLFTVASLYVLIGIVYGAIKGGGRPRLMAAGGPSESSPPCAPAPPAVAPEAPALDVADAAHAPEAETTEDPAPQP